MKRTFFLLLALGSLHSHAAPTATFEMKIPNARVFHIGGATSKTDLTIRGDITPGSIEGSFITSPIAVISESTPNLSLSDAAAQQLARLFWETASYEVVVSRRYRLGLYFDFGRITRIELVHPELPHLSVDQIPYHRQGQVAPIHVRELHLFLDSLGKVETVNAKFVNPKLDWSLELGPLALDPEFSDYLGNGKMYELITEREPGPPIHVATCLTWVVAAAAVSAGAGYLIFFR